MMDAKSQGDKNCIDLIRHLREIKNAPDWLGGPWEFPTPETSLISRGQ